MEILLKDYPIGVIMKKTMTEIKTEIAKKENEVKELEKELNTIKEHCPHPTYFVSSTTTARFDDCGGPDIYEGSYTTYSCSLCEGEFSMSWHKNMRKTPTIEECINVRT
jgi:hypothetical protein